MRPNNFYRRKFIVMKKASFSPDKTFFAAANGYTGFRSYFKEIFDSRQYERIYILKGGPGTGKSSLMKKIGNTASSVGFDTEAILCSSDPSSLDGVIIKNGEKKVAVLDGTAPHIRDAELPGVTDSLIDLGKCWDEKTLALHKDEIISINQKKSGYYSDAYSYLSVMREIDTKIKAELRKNYNFKKGNDYALSIIDTVCTGKKGDRETRLISSVGKFGSYNLDTLQKISGKIFYAEGKHGEERLFLSQLRERLSDMNTGITIFPSVFADEDTDAVFFKEGSAAVSSLPKPKTDASNENIFIDCSELLSPDARSDRLSLLNDMKRNLLKEAEESFKLAGDTHAELEKIYTPAMDFGAVNKITEKLSSSVLSVLE